jgi:hypothetical protein
MFERTTEYQAVYVGEFPAREQHATRRGGAVFASGIPATELELQTARGYASGKVALVYRNANRT